MNEQGTPVAETAGPTCEAGSQSPMAIEMAQRAALARLQARMIAEARAAAAARPGGDAEVVVLNGGGYNYRPPERGAGPVVAPTAPAR